MKRLVCFFDGTWDRPEDKDVTNVVKLQRATLKADHKGIEQLTHYELGIATEFTGRLSFLAGALSVGFGNKVRGAYRFLCKHFEPGDELFLFGFSRGAFEARSLAELISIVGLVRAESLDRVRQACSAYRRYRSKPEHKKLLRLRTQMHFPVQIKCVGVWDTVGTLAIPIVQRKRGGRINELPDNVDVGLHALAIDEPRGPFGPILWSKKRNAAVRADQIVEQAWFPGSHADVGGGGSSHALADAALLWMAKRASETTGIGIDLDSLQATTTPDPEGEQCLPTTGLYRISALAPFVRLIKQDLRAVHPIRRIIFRGWRTNRLARDQVPVNEVIHESAIARFGRAVPVRRGEEVRQRIYRPRSLKAAIDKGL